MKGLHLPFKQCNVGNNATTPDEGEGSGGGSQSPGNGSGGFGLHGSTQLLFRLSSVAVLIVPPNNVIQ